MVSQDNIERTVIEIISKNTGFTEDVIGCWYCNYQSNSCGMIHSNCKHLYICNLLENRYTSHGDINE